MVDGMEDTEGIMDGVDMVDIMGGVKEEIVMTMVFAIMVSLEIMVIQIVNKITNNQIASNQITNNQITNNQIHGK
jgi:hypothetical protein